MPNWQVNAELIKRKIVVTRRVLDHTMESKLNEKREKNG